MMMKHTSRIVVVAALIAFAAGACAETASHPLSVVQDGIEFGPPSEFAGVYFTNFENSKFTECNGDACKAWIQAEQERLLCVPEACEDLGMRIKAMNGCAARWATFKVVFAGRRSVHRSPKQHMYDTESKVLLERIKLFELLENQPSDAPICNQ